MLQLNDRVLMVFIEFIGQRGPKPEPHLSDSIVPRYKNTIASFSDGMSPVSVFFWAREREKFKMNDQVLMVFIEFIGQKGPQPEPRLSDSIVPRYKNIFASFSDGKSPVSVFFWASGRGKSSKFDSVERPGFNGFYQIHWPERTTAQAPFIRFDRPKVFEHTFILL